MPGEPFWEAGYREDDADTWGSPSDRLAAIVDRLPASSFALDVGCGEGRNALYLAEQGFAVRAFDHSEAAIRKLQRRAKAKGLAIESWVGDVADFEFDRHYGVIVAEGILQFVDSDVGDRFLTAARLHTLPGGAHVHSVFTDVVAPPEDLAPFIRRLFKDGELRDLYADWQIEQFRSYILEDEHPGGLRHRHAINGLVAWHLDQGA